MSNEAPVLREAELLLRVAISAPHVNGGPDQLIQIGETVYNRAGFHARVLNFIAALSAPAAAAVQGEDVFEAGLVESAAAVLLTGFGAKGDGAARAASGFVKTLRSMRAHIARSRPAAAPVPGVLTNDERACVDVAMNDMSKFSKHIVLPGTTIHRLLERLRSQPKEAAPTAAAGGEFVLVPREPTEAMLAKGLDAHLPQSMSAGRLAILYRAMLAAPAAPAEKPDA